MNKEVRLRIGFALPQIGAIAGPDAITRVARRAEELGFDTLWVLDRLLYPVNPRAPYPVGDGTLPINGNLEYMASATPKERADFTGSPDQIATDFEATKKLGASELVCDVQFSPGIETVDDILRRMEEIRTMAKSS